IQLESFGVTTLKPLGTSENPIVRIVITFIPIGTASYQHQVGICYPQHQLLADNPKFQTFTISVGPFAVRPEEVTFYLYVKDTGCTYLSTDPSHCIVESVGYNVKRYTWEDREEGIEAWDTMDISFTVTFIGAETP
ncbi:hypothetical protein KAX02_11290, partial [candidate division WOR-3 bacterium]|nr:hypothetical protein [candidate division WOR-3 bacterium]